MRRDWFFEQRDGNCRLMASLAVKISESAQIWRRAIAPFAEGINAILDGQPVRRLTLGTFRRAVEKG